MQEAVHGVSLQHGRSAQNTLNVLCHYGVHPCSQKVAHGDLQAEFGYVFDVLSHLYRIHTKFSDRTLCLEGAPNDMNGFQEFVGVRFLTQGQLEAFYGNCMMLSLVVVAQLLLDDSRWLDL